MRIYTIGFTKKSAEDFFNLIQNNNIECLIDVRLNNVSQLAGFSKAKDLQYFLKKITNTEYIHNIEYAPTEDILNDYKKNRISWDDYKIKYDKLITLREVEKIFINDSKPFKNICLLCSEPAPQNCHRRLLAEYLKNKINNVNIIHL